MNLLEEYCFTDLEAEHGSKAVPNKMVEIDATLREKGEEFKYVVYEVLARGWSWCLYSPPKC